MVTTSWVDPDTNVLLDAVVVEGDEVIRPTVVKGAQIARDEYSELDSTEVRPDGLEASRGLLPAMPSEDVDAGTDGLDAGADENNAVFEVFGGLDELPDGGSQSKPTL